MNGAYEGSSSTFKHSVKAHVHLAIILDEGFKLLDGGNERAPCPRSFFESISEPFFQDLSTDRQPSTLSKVVDQRQRGFAGHDELVVEAKNYN